MKKPKSGRKQIKPVEQASIMDKKFTPALIPRKRVDRTKVHPLFVLADLRRGSLASLDRYLAQEGGIPDRQVAIELRKLISGSVHRSRFRLLVVDHPRSPKSKGGRPHEPNEETLARYRSMVACYERFLPTVGQKKYLALEKVAAEFECNETTVKRAIRSVREALRQTEKETHSQLLERQRRAKIIERRNAALEKLHEDAKKRSD